MPLVSIIVPVYNAESNIRKCVDSILKQNFRDFELILMDDGSTDRSGEICDTYGRQDSRVRVVHKENSGASDTRNQGIAMATGRYLQFVDSDDWITPEATECFLRAATENHCDMVITDFWRVIGEHVSRKGSIETEGVMDRQDFAVEMMRTPADFYYGVLWNKFYDRSIVEENHIRMDDSLSWCEDFLFNLSYIQHIDRIFVLKMPIYYYVRREGSLSMGNDAIKTIQMKRRVFESYNEFCKTVFGEPGYEKNRRKVYRFLIDVANDGIIPVIGSHRLGNERTRISEQALEGEGTFFDLYQERKLQDKLFDIAALRNDLKTDDVKLLFYLSQPHQHCSYEETAEILNISRIQLTRSLARLLDRKMISDLGVLRPGEGEESTYGVTREADTVISEVLFLLCDFEQAQFEGFSQEERETFERLNKRRRENIREALR